MICRGITLVELLVVLAVSAVLATLAAPSFQQARAAAAVRSAVAQTLSVLHLARRLALSRGQSMTVCAPEADQRCGFEATEWLLLANAEGSDARLDAGDEILRRWRLPAGVRVTGSRGYAAFQPRVGAASTLTLQFSHAQSSLKLSVVVSQTGRPRLTSSS